MFPAVALFLMDSHRQGAWWTLCFFVPYLANWTVGFIELGSLLWWVNEAAFARYCRQAEAPRQSRVPGSPTEHALGDKGRSSN
jgi:hypothetical protein